ncbi:GNAT family N-acetyltransferase [Lachnospiraceae bacterium 62-35]
MEIRRTEKKDLDQLMEIYEMARAFMAENGNPNQWGLSYPDRALLEEDVEEGNSYVCVDDGGEILGTFYFRIGDDMTYHVIQDGAWLNDEPYGVIHRIASAARSKGVAGFCLNWCLERCTNLRIDTHRQNIPMQRFLEKNGFIPCGTIFTDDGTKRIAYQKKSHHPLERPKEPVSTE